MNVEYVSVRRRKSRWVIALLVGSALATGCSLNPLTGRRQVVLTSLDREREIGREEASKVERSMGLVDDPQLASYVDSIGQSLVKQVPDTGVEFQFLIVDMAEPNAFALPGGYVYVSRGLLALVNSEDELANVIGHEVSHVMGRHSGQRQTIAAPFAIVTGLGAMATSIVSPALGDVVAGVGGLTGTLVVSSYSREQEREADRFGMELAAGAGWEPAALSQFLHTLEREEALRGGKVREFSFFASHPSTPERVRNSASRAGSISRGSYEPVAGDRAEVLARLDGLLIGDDPAAGVFVGDRFLQPALDLSLQFPAGWKKENERQAVSAIEPDGKALVALQVAGQGSDPMDAARAAARQLKFVVGRDVEQLTIAGLPAVRVKAPMKAPQANLVLDLTWIAHGDTIYQIVGACSPSRFASYRELFLDTARSFRSLRADELEAIWETRLRIREGREGETMDEFLVRTDGIWTAAETAVANGLEASAPLREGQLVKIPIRQPYSASVANPGPNPDAAERR